MPATLRLAVVCALLSGCFSFEESVTDDPPPKTVETDDAAPAETAFDASLDFTAFDGQPENNSGRRFRFDIAREEKLVDVMKPASFLVASHGAFLKAHPDAMPSVQTVGTYFKQLDDTIYAGLELAVQQGLQPTLAPKRGLLRELLAEVLKNRSANRDAAAVYLAVGLELGGEAASVPAELRPAIDAAKARFTSDPLFAKPIGFYTWSNELRQIFTQDRWLQQPFERDDDARALAAVLSANAELLGRYRKLLNLYARLTNPMPLGKTLLRFVDGLAASDTVAFVPASWSVEVELFEELYPDGIPENADLMQDLIDAIRSGTIDLTPKPDAGWYAWQEYALETLLVTDKAEERKKVGFTAKYKKRLVEAFKTMLVQHRETHVKTLEFAEATSASVDMRGFPLFRVEPLATVYVRHARSCVFLEAALDAVLGPEVLDKAVAVGEGGPTHESLRARIRRVRDLFFGIYLNACYELGMQPLLATTGDPDKKEWAALREKADVWRRGLADDPIANADVRVIVPIAVVDETHATYWAVVGVRETKVAYSFVTGSDMAEPPFGEQGRYLLPTEQFIQFVGSRNPPTRDEFRAICDAHADAGGIKAALEAR